MSHRPCVIALNVIVILGHSVGRRAGFEKFYPMTVGEVINEKYMVVAKLGFGLASTIWCGRNLEQVSLKGLKEDNIDNEIAICKHLSTAGNPDHPGKMYVRTIQDFFVVTSRAGNPYQCLVHEVLSNDILSLRYARPDRKLPEAMLKQILIHLLLALDFLHSEYERREYLAGFGRFIYLGSAEHKRNRGIEPLQKCQWIQSLQKRKLRYPNKVWPPDFADPYRSLEVILEMPWGYAVDTWNIGVMVWDMFENRCMFDVLDPETGKYGNRFHLASIVGLLGPPPLEFLQRGECSSVYFDARGTGSV
ncbi:hypothetical protein B7494_g4749 [Chlorociboria aeruginascens]|nr:hypothetical protein B7494_g4749 [Chlorociboria aeruginascens]